MEITVFFELMKILRKKFGNNFLFLGLKTTCLSGSKSLETPVWGLNTAVSENSELTKISKFVQFQTFQKLQKNDVKLELRKSRKTRSDSNVWFKVRNVGP